MEVSIKPQPGDIYDEDHSRFYRDKDEASLQGRVVRARSRLLGDICRSFDRRIDVLELGCGTGRYFHALRNTRKLVGLDYSQHMLDLARNPVRAEEMDVDQIELKRFDATTDPLPVEAFDFVYSIGVLAEFVKLSVPLINGIHDALRPGGVAFFTTVDKTSRPQNSIKERLAEKVSFLLPMETRQRLAKQRTYNLSLSKLERTMARSRFTDYSNERIEVEQTPTRWFYTTARRD